MGKLRDRLRFWMLGPMLAIVIVIELFVDLSGYRWAVLYGSAALFIYAVMGAVIDREGQPMRDRSEFRHGLDMHGHYR